MSHGNFYLIWNHHTMSSCQSCRSCRPADLPEADLGALNVPVRLFVPYFVYCTDGLSGVCIELETQCVSSVACFVIWSAGMRMNMSCSLLQLVSVLS